MPAMHRNQSVNVHSFTMVPKPDIPRSSFTQEKTHKTTIDAGYLIPMYLQEVLPGDTMNLQMTAFLRLATPLFPVMDNLHVDSFFFFVPYRLLWTNWRRMMGQQDNPGSSISFTIPQIVTKASGYDINSVFDYMGLPTLGQMQAAATTTHSALPLRAYNLIYNEWFRDENLQNAAAFGAGDGPDLYTAYTLLRRGKRKDYFTSALPWPQKGTAVSLPLGTTAPVYGDGKGLGIGNATLVGTLAANNTITPHVSAFTVPAPGVAAGTATGGTDIGGAGNISVGVLGPWASNLNSGLYADLTTATAATINQLRQSIAIQALLEKDARGGTRYTEIIRQQFGVASPDARLQRPEYLGGGSAPITINPIAQTSGTGATGQTTPLANLSGVGAGVARGHGFTQSFTEHGIIVGLIEVRADLTYQQGIQRFWNRLTRYDFYTPVFANLGEQTVLNKEIYVRGDANDNLVFGYQERWAEYRYDPSMITGLFRSTAAGTIDPWHLAQNFTSLPTLNATFIEDRPPVDRIVAVGAAANGQQFIVDTFFRNKMARPMPMYSIPGMMMRF